MLYEQLLDAARAAPRARCRRWRARWRRLDALAALAERAGDARTGARPQFVARAVHRDRARPPSGGRGAPARNRRRQLHRQRLPARRDAPHAGHHRPEHGRQEHLHAPGRADRAARRDRLATCRRRRCRLGPIDAIHTRIGAADDLANAQSTFMVEMTEAAAIVHGATEHSLVLMDEIGRGTSTFDGLALAGAIARHLHDSNRAFTLFATHYFELTEFPVKHERALNVHVSAVESGDDIVFLHEIEAGPASRSYGVQVARLAGMPPALLRQARATLEALEAQQIARAARRSTCSPRRAERRRRRDERGDSALEAALAALDPDMLVAERSARRALPPQGPARRPVMTYCVARQARRRPRLPLRLAHQRRPRPDQHLPQDDGLRAARRPLHGAAVGRQPLDLAAGARDPADRGARRRRASRRSRSGTRPACSTPRACSAPRCAASTTRTARRSKKSGLDFNASMIFGGQIARRGDAPVPGLLGRQLHRGDARDLLLPDRRVEVRQARARPHDARRRRRSTRPPSARWCRWTRR